MMKLKGKVAVVTRGGQEFGRLSALRLAKLGADVVIQDWDLDSGKKQGEKLTADTVMDEIRALDRRCTGYEVDITDKKAVDDMFARIMDEYSRVDILVNAHRYVMGFDKPELLYAASVTEEKLNENMYVNFFATVWTCQAAARAMMQQKSGKIITIVSNAALRAQMVGKDFHAGGYGPGLAAVINYSWHLASELGVYGVNVNCISAGASLTHSAKKLAEAGTVDLKQYASNIPLGKLNEPDDLAKVVEFLATDLSDMVTAQTLVVDGGGIRFR
ncbi:SDR family NAD(P)-dependent oxidoreductase [Chloroflexota bacterium]